MLLIPLLLVLGLASCSGPETTVSALRPDLVAAPETLEFSVVEQQSDSLQLQLMNAGRDTLKVSSITVDASADVFAIEPTELLVEPDTYGVVLVTFTPSAVADFGCNLVIASNHEDSPTAVPVVAEGIPVPTPDIELDTLELDFGNVPLLETSTLYFTVFNVGNEVLNVGSTHHSGAGTFTIVSDPEGQQIAPGGAFPVVIEYLPTAAQRDSASFTIESDDPDESSVSVELLGGTGEAITDYPEADIDCPTGALPRQTLTFSGSGTDPQGYEITDYEWSLSTLPVGSSTELVTDAATAQLFVDMAGLFEVELVVTNELGVRSAPEECRVSVEPTAAVHVELVWDRPQSDLDLHMLQEDAELFDTPGDCCWCNTPAEWGEAGEEDNGSLVVHNDEGYGPEESEIQEPADGEYPIRVHYYNDRGGGPVTATVNVYIYGVREATTSRVLEENQVWEAATVRWPEGYVVEETTEVYTQDGNVRSCH